MSDRSADQPAVHIEFLEFFIFCSLHFRVFTTLPYAIAVCMCLPVCMPCFWTSGKRLEIKTSFFQIARNNTGHNLQEFDTKPMTYSKMADQMAAAKRYNRL